MAKYLKTKQEYSDIYDRMTVEDCRWRENFHNNFESDQKYEGKVNKKLNRAVSDMALHYDLLYTTVDRYNSKEKTIQEWIERDTEKDELYENAEAPKDIRCLKCQSFVSESSKVLWNHSDEEDRVLFMYDCPNGCLPHRAFFNDGEEYKIKPNICPKCQSILERSSERVEDKKVVTTLKCSSCNYKETDELDLTTKEEPIDTEYEKDRERFCLSGKRLEDNLKERNNLEQIASFMDRLNEKEKHKDEYEEIKKLKKLTIVSLEELLVPICEKAKYVKFRFGDPDMGKDLLLPFTVHDANPERIDRASSHDLQKIIKKALEDTNWRLMSDGVSYRMGILSGRLRAYEKEEDLLGLVKGD
ncbi:MAG TPA: hypothetical protein PKA60_00570 [Candidatus Paceibacterota bacterium]|nr:hypothetical protein [Candidatus Paceibacterota bacterium]